MTSPPPTVGWRIYLLGFVGVAIFSLTLPATRVAVADWSPVMVALGRALVAAGLAAIVLAVTRQPIPTWRQWRWLGLAALGVVFGYPLFTAFAMLDVPSSHGGIVLGVMPLATALAGAAVAGDRPSMAFWVVAALGSLTVTAYALLDGAGSFVWADLWLLLAIIIGSVGYAAGAVVSWDLGGWQVICWVLVLSVPALLPPVLWYLPDMRFDVHWSAWAAFVYVAVFSQFLGFFAWNAALAKGGVARIGQMLLLQPFLTLFFAALLLSEVVDVLDVGFAVLIVALVSLGRRMPVAQAPAAR